MSRKIGYRMLGIGHSKLRTAIVLALSFVATVLFLLTTVRNDMQKMSMYDYMDDLNDEFYQDVDTGWCIHEQSMAGVKLVWAREVSEIEECHLVKQEVPAWVECMRVYELHREDLSAGRIAAYNESDIGELIFVRQQMYGWPISFASTVEIEYTTYASFEYGLNSIEAFGTMLEVPTIINAQRLTKNVIIVYPICAMANYCVIIMYSYALRLMRRRWGSCIHCGYKLHPEVGAKCPECGKFV